MTKAHYRRRLQGSTWRNVNIYFDPTEMFSQNPKRADFYKKVLEIVKSWWGQVLYVRDSPEQIASTMASMIGQGYEEPFAATS
jgi:hypothetical protein